MTKLIRKSDLENLNEGGIFWSENEFKQEYAAAKSLGATRSAAGDSGYVAMVVLCERGKGTKQAYLVNTDYTSLSAEDVLPLYETSQRNDNEIVEDVLSENEGFGALNDVATLDNGKLTLLKKVYWQDVDKHGLAEPHNRKKFVDAVYQDYLLLLAQQNQPGQSKKDLARTKKRSDLDFIY